MIPCGFRPAVDKSGNPFPHYYVASDGRIGSTHPRGDRQVVGTFHLLSSFTTAPYLQVSVRVNGQTHMQQVHVLVARSWIGIPTGEDPEVNHKDGNKRNNDCLNLEWTDSIGNARHATMMGMVPHGERNGQAKLTGKDVRIIRIMHAHGWSQHRLVSLFRVSTSTISRAVLGDSWNRLGPGNIRARPIGPPMGERIIALLRAMGDSGATAVEVGASLGGYQKTVSANMSGLLKAGITQRTGERRRTSSGRGVSHYVVRLTGETA